MWLTRIRRRQKSHRQLVLAADGQLVGSRVVSNIEVIDTDGSKLLGGISKRHNSIILFCHLDDSVHH